MSIQEDEDEMLDNPLLFKDEDGQFYSLAPDQELLGPYSTPERAVEKHHEYCAYTVFAAKCHCPHP